MARRSLWREASALADTGRLRAWMAMSITAAMASAALRVTSGTSGTGRNCKERW
jgi:hypothetical protein